MTESFIEFENNNVLSFIIKNLHSSLNDQFFIVLLKKKTFICFHITCLIYNHISVQIILHNKQRTLFILFLFFTPSFKKSLDNLNFLLKQLSVKLLLTILWVLLLIGKNFLIFQLKYFINTILTDATFLRFYFKSFIIFNR